MYNKIVSLNFEGKELEQSSWKKIAALGKEMTLIRDSDSLFFKHLKNTDCLLVKHGVSVDKQIIDAAPSLKYIGVLATSFGRIDVTYAAKKNITVCNVPGYATEGVAELVFALLLERLRKISSAKAQAKKGDYSEIPFMGTEIRGKSFGVIGLGRIGRRVAELALNGFQARVSYWSQRRKKDAENHGISYLDLDTLIKTSSIISLHTSYNPEMEKIFNKRRIQMIKPGTIIINTAPMELVDIDALATRLKKNDITFILDHSDELSPKQSSLLSQYDNCILYPPIGLMTKEATKAKQEIFIANLENFLKGKPQNVVS